MTYTFDIKPGYDSRRVADEILRIAGYGDTAVLLLPPGEQPELQLLKLQNSGIDVNIVSVEGTIVPRLLARGVEKGDEYPDLPHFSVSNLGTMKDEAPVLLSGYESVKLVYVNASVASGDGGMRIVSCEHVELHSCNVFENDYSGFLPSDCGTVIVRNSHFIRNNLKGVKEGQIGWRIGNIKGFNVERLILVDVNTSHGECVGAWSDGDRDDQKRRFIVIRGSCVNNAGSGYFPEKCDFALFKNVMVQGNGRMYDKAKDWPGATFSGVNINSVRRVVFDGGRYEYNKPHEVYVADSGRGGFWCEEIVIRGNCNLTPDDIIISPKVIQAHKAAGRPQIKITKEARR